MISLNVLALFPALLLLGVSGILAHRFAPAVAARFGVTARDVDEGVFCGAAVALIVIVLAAL